MSASYVFHEEWHLPSGPEAVREVLVDLEHYPSWWPQVRAVASLGPDDALVCCRSALPFTLDLVLHAVSRELPTVEVAISGHLAGFARWTVEPDRRGSDGGAGSRMVFEQEVRVGRRLALLTPLARPVLEWNHARMMAGCRTGLEARLRQLSPSGR